MAGPRTILWSCDLRYWYAIWMEACCGLRPKRIACELTCLSRMRVNLMHWRPSHVACSVCVADRSLVALRTITECARTSAGGMDCGAARRRARDCLPTRRDQ